MCIEARQPHDLVDHVGGVVEHDHAARAEQRPFRDAAFVVEQAALRLLAVQDRDGRASRDARLERAAGPHPASELVHEVLQREAHRHFVVPRFLYVPADREQLCPGALGAGERHRLVPRRPMCDDVRHDGECLHIVDRRRHTEDAEGGGERRLDAGVTALALDRAHERRFFAADVRSRALVQVDLAHSQRFGGGRFGEGLLHDGERLGELPADIDVGDVRLDRVHRDERALEQRVRCPAHDLAVLERPGL